MHFIFLQEVAYVAQLKDTLITGSLRVTDATTIQGTLTLSNSQDAGGTAANAVALIIGGNQAQEHIEIDSNEILAKSGATAISTLYLQDGTGTVVVNGSGGLTVRSTTSSTSKTTGALKVSGGGGFEGTVYANGFNGPLTGNASSATALKNSYTNSTRPTDANIDHVNDGGVVHFKVTSAMLSHKPVGTGNVAGNVLHFHWDSSSAWNSQLFIPSTGNSYNMQWRTSTAAGTWGDWRTLLDSTNYTTYTSTITSVGTLTSLGVSGATTHSGHIYMTGTASGGASTTTQMVFTNSDKSTQYVALTANTNKKLVINPASNSSTGQVILAVGGASAFTSSEDTTLTINGSPQSTYTFKVAGTTNITGNTTIGGTLSVTGAITGSLTGNCSGSSGSCTGNAATATSWAAAQTVYVALGTASKTTTIQGGNSSAVTLGVDGKLGAGNGGTGQNSYTTGDILYASSSSALSKLAIGTAGKFLKATSSGPSWASTTDITAVGTLTSLAVSGAATLSSTLSVTGNTTISGTLTAATITSASAMNISTTSSATMKLDSASTVYISSGSSSSLIFCRGGTDTNHEVGRFDTTGVFLVGNDINIKANANSYGYRFIRFQTSGGNTAGSIRYDRGDATNIAKGQFSFFEFSPNSTATTNSTGSSEIYRLPEVATGLSDNVYYNIITEKNLSDITSVGTLGATTCNLTANTTNYFTLQMKGTECGKIRLFKLGTTSQEGMCDIVLGNSSNSETANNASGRLLMYDSSGTYLILAAKTGTLAGTSRHYLEVDKWFTAAGVVNAVWNDYAECRNVDTDDRGYCVTETASGQMVKTTKRLQAGCKITSDTFGSCMGETAEAKTPIAVSGRVLVYPYRNPIHYQLGDAVCSAPGGTVDIMTRDEIMKYPERIVGTVSEIPNYEVWHGGRQDGENDIQVNGRIWVYVR